MNDQQVYEEIASTQSKFLSTLEKDGLAIHGDVIKESPDIENQG